MTGKRARRATERRVARCTPSSAERAVRRVEPAASSARRAAAALLTTCSLLTLGACSDDSDSPDPSAAGAGSCPSDLPTDLDCPGAAPQYGAVIADVVEQRCQGCHFPQNPFSSQVFGDYAQLFAARRTAFSQVYGCRMPPVDAPQLRAEERGALLKWFVCGAPEN